MWMMLAVMSVLQDGPVVEAVEVVAEVPRWIRAVSALLSIVIPFLVSGAFAWMKDKWPKFAEWSDGQQRSFYVAASTLIAILGEYAGTVLPGDLSSFTPETYVTLLTAVLNAILYSKARTAAQGQPHIARTT